jgi:hypothetical protein
MTAQTVGSVFDGCKGSLLSRRWFVTRVDCGGKRPFHPSLEKHSGSRCGHLATVVNFVRNWHVYLSHNG